MDILMGYLLGCFFGYLNNREILYSSFSWYIVVEFIPFVNDTIFGIPIILPSIDCDRIELDIIRILLEYS